MNKGDLSIVLVNWNGCALTSTALESIKEYTSGIKYEVFVIDNGTTRDSSVTELPERFPWITFIANQDNQGFSKANNQGIRLARGRYVLLLNNDTVQTQNALGESVRYMDAHPDVGALGIAHLNSDEGRSRQPSFYSFPNPWMESANLLGIPVRPKRVQVPLDTSQEADVDWICGSFLLMRRECLEQVGELDERFFLYDEDVDWCLRAHRTGWNVRYWPGVTMIHVGSAAMPFMKDKTFLHFRSHLSYYCKNHGSLAGISYYCCMGIRLVRATAWHLVLFLLGKEPRAVFRERYWRQMQFLGLRPSKKGV